MASIETVPLAVDRDEALLIGEFHQGQAAANRDAYRSDCPHMPGTDRHDAWIAGFEEQDGDTRFSRRAQGSAS